MVVTPCVQHRSACHVSQGPIRVDRAIGRVVFCEAYTQTYKCNFKGKAAFRINVSALLMTVDFAGYQTRRRSERSAFVTELLRKAFALFVGCHVRQIELEICRTKTFAPEPDCDADPVVAVAAVTGSADALAPRLVVLEQGTRCEWNQALR